MSYLYVDLSGTAGGCPAALLPLRRFFSDGIGKWYIDVSRAVMRGVSFVIPVGVAPQVLLADYLSSGCEARSLLKDLPDNFRRHAALLTLLSPILVIAFPPIAAFIPLAVPASLVLADITEALRDGKPISAETISRVLNLGQQWSSVVGSVRPDLAEDASKNAALKAGAVALRSASVPKEETPQKTDRTALERAKEAKEQARQRAAAAGAAAATAAAQDRLRVQSAPPSVGFPIVPAALVAGVALFLFLRR